MAERPRTFRPGGPASTVLKWVAGVVAAVVGAILVVIMTSTAAVVWEHSERLTRIETLDEEREKSLVRIERRLDRMNEKLDEINARLRPRGRAAASR